MFHVYLINQMGLSLSYYALDMPINQLTVNGHCKYYMPEEALMHNPMSAEEPTSLLKHLTGREREKSKQTEFYWEKNL